MRICEPYTIFKRTLKSGKVVYYYQFRDETGKRSSARSTGCSTRPQALRFCAKLYREGLLIFDNSTTFGVFAKGFFDADSNFVKWRKLSNTPVKPTTLDFYRKNLNATVLPYFKDIRLFKINKETVRSFILAYSDKVSPSTINNYLTVLSLVLDNAVERQLIKINPACGFKLKVEKKHKELLTIEELKLLYNDTWSIPIYKSVFLLSVITGMRIGETLALTKNDIKGNYLDIHSSLSDDHGILDSNKTGVNRYVPIPISFPFPETDCEFIFSKKGTYITTASIYFYFVDKCQKNGINHKERGVTVHSLRNFFITYLRSKNVSDPKIRAVVGHADETMTDVYTRWTPDMFPEVYKAQKELFDTITGGMYGK